MRELFIYYRVRGVDAASTLAQVRDLQAQLATRHPDLTARLLRRPESVDGQQTWMETYAVDARHGPAGIDAALQAEIETAAANMRPPLPGPRHAEVFVACAS